jgi:hypothetical protein
MNEYHEPSFNAGFQQGWETSAKHHVPVGDVRLICRACRGAQASLGDLRFGVCWDCADAGERKAAQRTVLQHLRSAVRNIARREWFGVKCDATWAWQRLTRTGYYKPGGIFEREYGIKV